MGIQLKIALALFAMALFGSISVGVYKGITHTMAVISQLSKNNAKLDGALTKQQEAIDASVKVLEEWQEAEIERSQTMEEMIELSRSANEETRRLNEMFSKHDMEDLARRNPRAVEKIINAGTHNALRMLECATGPRYRDCSFGDNQAKSNTTPTEPPPG